MADFKVHIAERFEMGDLALHVRRDSLGGHAMLVPLSFVEAVEGTVPSPCVSGPDCGPIIQAIVDEAWGKGIRPRAALLQTNATDKHLEDMRAIAFHKLGIKDTTQ